MEPKQPQQPSRNDTDSPPGWVREPAESTVESTRAPITHDEPPIEEPGYGHGV